MAASERWLDWEPVAAGRMAGPPCARSGDRMGGTAPRRTTCQLGTGAPSRSPPPNRTLGV